jgi:hypothetical protein
MNGWIFGLVVICGFGMIGASEAKPPKGDRIPILYYDQLGKYKVSVIGPDAIIDVYEHGEVTTGLDKDGKVDSIKVEIRTDKREPQPVLDGSYTNCQLTQPANGYSPEQVP